MSEHVEHYEADHHPEVVENGKVVRRLELLGADEAMKTPEARRELMAGLSDEDFQHFLGYVNSITRGQPITYEYADGTMPMLATPPLEEKARLMNEAYAVVRGLLRDPETDAQDALDRAGLTLAGAINLIHPYMNGNGRTGRVAHYLVTFGSQRGEEAMEAELYGAIAKLRPYEFDKRVSIYDMPPTSMEQALNEIILKEDPDAARYDPLRHPSRRVETFLRVMSGSLDDEASRGIVASYEADYQRLSFVANNEPSTMPEEARRILATPDPRSYSTKFIDVI